MEKEIMFANLPKEQRAEQLEAIAKKTAIEVLKRPYSEDDKIQMKDFVMEESIILKDQSDEMKAIVKEFQTAIKKAKESIADAITRFKKGVSENEEKVYYIDDQEAGTMDVVDANGVILYTRKLFPDEKQTTAKFLEMKTGTND